MRNASSTDEPPHPTPPTPRQYRSPTMSSPVLLETPQSSLHRPKPTRKLDSRRTGRCVRRDAAAPYTRTRSANSGDRRRSKSHASPELEKLHSFLRAAQPDDVFVPAQWPWDVAHLREMYNPLATIFPAVQHHGWCDCSSPCRADSCRNSLMHIYCNVNSCPYEGLCGNGAKRALEEDKDTQEASFAKAKRVRAMKATTALKSQLDGLENAANNTRGSILETILLLREENERKAEARREEEEQRRRNDLAAMENRRLAERAEAEERRRTEKQEMEERARRDREEARARTQELLMLIGALTKKS
ncbi:hypothetical protein AM588_10005035 [Phytophthora nicotianae]|uniref:Uncharacterized protein n=1 Tax=Phytophthora nicotianae TaxID=4792 RepID=A0A0W8DBQ6_PHYNI|nr:hypothetical protein AM588_10005035 [Phytophthora nicotianae]